MLNEELKELGSLEIMDIFRRCKTIRLNHGDDVQKIFLTNIESEATSYRNLKDNIQRALRILCNVE